MNDKRILYVVLVLCLTILTMCKDEEVARTYIEKDEAQVSCFHTTADFRWQVNSYATINSVVLEYAQDPAFASYLTAAMELQDGIYTTSLSQLTAGANYYCRFRAINQVNTCLSQVYSFTTQAYADDLATVRTDAITKVMLHSVSASATLQDWGCEDIVSVGFCYATHPNATKSDNYVNASVELNKDSLSYSCEMSGMAPNQTYYIRAFATNSKGTAYGKEMTAIPCGFSVSPTQNVRFAPGNLQFNASVGSHACADGTTQQGTWRFAENQYDTIGAPNVFASESYNGWIDLFGCGTSGWNSGAVAYQPWSTNGDYKDYFINNYQRDLQGKYANADWGVYNAISNGGNAPKLWRTLSIDEWTYLVQARENASSLRAEAEVCGVWGIVLLPDGWEKPATLNLVSMAEDYVLNHYTPAEWNELESTGAIFLPETGQRDYDQYYGCNYRVTDYDEAYNHTGIYLYYSYDDFYDSYVEQHYIHYWSSSYSRETSTCAYVIYFSSPNYTRQYDMANFRGLPVRLAQDVE